MNNIFNIQRSWSKLVSTRRSSVLSLPQKAQYINEHKWTVAFISFTKQYGWNLSELLFRPLTKFGGKLWKFSLTKTFGFDWISYCFISFMTKIFRSAWILQLPIQHHLCINNHICEPTKETAVYLFYVYGYAASLTWCSTKLASVS